MLRGCGVLLVVIGGLTAILSGVEQQRDGLEERADRVVSAFMAAHRLPAISVAVADHGGIRYRRAFGLADVENRHPATPETVFRIASVTKPLTAVGVLRLVDTGRLDLDEPIQTYCPAYANGSARITARLLMAHLAGLADYTRIDRGVWKVVTHGGIQEGSSTVYVPDLNDAVAVFAQDELRSDPGARYYYSNPGYVLLGCAIEGASEQSYSGFMAREIFEPLRMTRTQPNDAYTVIENRARPYQMRTEETADRWWFIPAQKRVMEIGRLYNARFEDTSHKLPAGGMLSTPSDLVRFGSVIVTGKFLAEGTRRAMMTEQKTRDGEGTGWGLGWTVGNGRIGLSGGQPGASATLSVIPSENIAIAVVTNRDLVPTGELVRELAAAWTDPRRP